jgi:hypothetical protein
MDERLRESCERLREKIEKIEKVEKKETTPKIIKKGQTLYIVRR